ncbi:hypothetical protein [Seleniivibrio woodruffii]|uniref:hypothetical protein n=1 Tax=Seleniivibrio woodruffii TaxID=1078050 RepID=UPI00240984FC|nr:hypothetical protein [Seleniivibrio woodruffii]
MFLLSDASILIDLDYVDSIERLMRIGQCEVLDVVVEECRDPKQPNIISNIEMAGIEIITTDKNIMDSALMINNPYLSYQDRMIYMYAKENNRIVLSGDKALREFCLAGDIECHGLIWLVEEFISRNILIPDEFLDWLPKLEKMGRRLPKQEIKRLCDKYK